jgi:hypothetical protein
LNCSHTHAISGRVVKVPKPIIILGRLHSGSQGKLERTGITDSNGIGASWSSDNSIEGTHTGIFNIDTHHLRAVIRSLPKLHIGIKRTTFCF